jgi:ribosomal protein L11 methyltransferase
VKPSRFPVWRQIIFDTPDDLKDAVLGELTDLGAAGVWESGEIELTAYFENLPAFDSIYTLFERAGLPRPQIVTSDVVDRDWGEEWKKSWASFPLGSRFFVIPSWLDTPCPEDRFPLLLDPGQAFGTGTHESTQLTLESMERYLKPAGHVFDLGTGSGILAIAALKLGASNVSGCDNDPVAVEVAQENLERNGAGQIRLMCSSIDAIATDSVDLLLCNLTADVIASIYADIHRVLRPQGIAIFSGILNFQASGIQQFARTHGHALLEQTTRGEWSALVVQNVS